MLYNFLIYLYTIIFRLVACFHHKARLMVRGHRQACSILKQQIDIHVPYIWFHAASLGEFEQGRPLMEKIKTDYPQYKILLTFYSPSGYEVRKDYAGADVVCYLPFDTERNAIDFLNLARPSMAIFIKYEFWSNYLTQLHQMQVPTYIISAVFRPKQVFFRWYGVWYRNLLNYFSYFFVQDEPSRQLLRMIGLTNVVVAGDTRFDRVVQNKEKAQLLPYVDQLRKPNTITLVAGSSWPKDELFLISYFNSHPNIKMIIAPHETHEEHIQSIISKLERPYVRFSEATAEEVNKSDCLIVDCIGLLSTLYRYGDIAYIGGGFGQGIHNSLEAAVYGIPVVFGPNFQKFREAIGLVACKGAFPVGSEADFVKLMDSMVSSKQALRSSGRRAAKYVSENLGATGIIMDMLDL